MQCQNESPYNIQSPEPFFAGSFVPLTFVISNPYSDQVVDLTNTADITFAITLLGTYNNDIVLRFSRKDKIGNIPRMIIDPIEKNVLTVQLFAEDTINFEDAWYNFQITLHSVDGLQDSVIGQGRVKIFKKI